LPGRAGIALNRTTPSTRIDRAPGGDLADFVGCVVIIDPE